ncbi:hypothetical protein PSTT_10318, partial [Puccinia striiformis]
SLGPKPIVIMFWAAWCEPCKHITPTFESLSDETIGLSFLLVDVDDKAFGLEFSRAHGIRAMPTFQIIVGGVKVAELLGADQEKLRVSFRVKSLTSVSCLSYCSSAELSFAITLLTRTLVIGRHGCLNTLAYKSDGDLQCP